MLVETKRRRLKRSSCDAGDATTKRSRRYHCDCPYISLGSCDVCAKIARKVYRLFGKRLALTEAERQNKPESGQEDGMLVLADESCDCLEVSSDSCPTCAAFSVKMGVFVTTYAKWGLGSGEEIKSQVKYPTTCDCAYLSSMGCGSCQDMAAHVERIFSKKVYPSLIDKDPLTDISFSQGHDSTTHVPAALKRYVAIDCEMVGVMDYQKVNAKGRPKMVSALARCSIVDASCNVLLDIYVKPDQPIADYRTRFSGITKADMKHAVSFDEARKMIINVLEGKIVVGHTLVSDFDAINYFHPSALCRDIVKSRRLRNMYLEKTKLRGPGLTRIGLKKLSGVLLGSLIQQGSHCSVEDAIHTMKLFHLVRKEWEDAPDTQEMTHNEGWLSTRSRHDNPVSNEVYLQDSYWSSITAEH
ncbi:uncharacterized protein [Watersipora subatra]|uniref:uncharacterized protein n=1 Tax=Watersipora subatra TaxID=2589382 RepID=UPI00355AE317